MYEKRRELNELKEQGTPQTTPTIQDDLENPDSYEENAGYSYYKDTDNLKIWEANLEMKD